jgi:hypothetical protein
VAIGWVILVNKLLQPYNSNKTIEIVTYLEIANNRGTCPLGGLDGACTELLEAGEVLLPTQLNFEVFILGGMALLRFSLVFISNNGKLGKF